MITSIKYSLNEWYSTTNRNLPWKKTFDPYLIWVSEIILQQTRVEQGTPYYLKITTKYPTVCHLANAPLEELLKMWEGLGYYSRARNLHFAAKEICFNRKGQFPSTYEEILSLKGVGKYTAAAIASFAYNLPYAVLDGNVYRVLSRLMASEMPIDTSAGQQYYSRLAQELLDLDAPGIHNQAIMDLGATVCTPHAPNCTECPLQTDCKAYSKNQMTDFPIKAKKILRKKRFFHYYIFKDELHTIITQRGEKDIWKQLFEFPMEEAGDANALETVKWENIVETDSENILSVKTSDTYKQLLTHRDILARFTTVHIKDIKKLRLKNENYQIILLSEWNTYAYPKIIRLFCEESSNLLV